MDRATLAGIASTDIDTDGDPLFTALMLNGWYEFETNSAWRPYVGGGIGYTNVDAVVETAPSVSSFNDSDGGFSYQIGFGVIFSVVNQERLISAIAIAKLRL